MRSGVCGQRGSGGKALSVAALAMPTRSAPSSRARRFTEAASIWLPSTLLRPPKTVSQIILSLKYLGCEAPSASDFGRADLELADLGLARARLRCRQIAACGA